MQKTEQLLKRIEQCNFQCEGGYLTNCTEWQELKAVLPPLLKQASVSGSAAIPAQVLNDLLKQKEAQHSAVLKWFEDEYNSDVDKDTVAEWESRETEYKAQIQLLRFILSQH